MGYRSDVRFAMRKEQYLNCQLLNNIPSAIKKLTPIICGDALYWEINDWKWYDSYPEVWEINQWFQWLEEENDLRGKGKLGIFGGMRIGEDDGDVQYWGYPGDFDIYLSRAISVPY